MRAPEIRLPFEAQDARLSQRKTGESGLTDVCCAVFFLTEFFEFEAIRSVQVQPASQFKSNIFETGARGVPIDFLQKTKIGIALAEFNGDLIETVAVVDVPGNDSRRLVMFPSPGTRWSSRGALTSATCGNKNRTRTAPFTTLCLTAFSLRRCFWMRRPFRLVGGVRQFPRRTSASRRNTNRRRRSGRTDNRPRHVNRWLRDPGPKRRQ